MVAAAKLRDGNDVFWVAAEVVLYVSLLVVILTAELSIVTMQACQL